MTTENNQLALTQPETGPVTLGYSDSRSFDHVQRVAKMFSESALVPVTFQKNIPNTVIALEMANRIGASPLAVMQSLYVVHGKPGWSSQFVIACLNTCGRFEPLMFEVTGTGDAKQCIAWTTSKGVKLTTRDDKKAWTIALAKEAGFAVFDGPPVSIGTAKAEGWYDKNGSKWKTLPDLMLRYRAASFFSSLYAPELKMGMKTYEEVIDVDTVSAAVQAEPVEVRFGRKTNALPEQTVAASSPALAESTTAETPVVAEPQPTLEPEQPETPPAEKPAAKKPEPKEESETEKIAQFYRAQANAGFDDLKKTMLRLQPGWKETLVATDYAGLTPDQAKAIWSGRHGIAREVKKDINAK
jgi:hypothetical protein